MTAILPLPRTETLPAVAWFGTRMLAGWLGVLAAGVLYLALFPRGMVNGDEYYYAGQAYTLAHARFLPTMGDPLPVVRGAEGAAVRFPVGWPLALSAFRFLGFRSMYLAPMLMHLAAGAAFARLMVRRGLPSWGNVVYLFHPVIWGLSRTIMSDVPAVALAVIAIDAWETGRSWLPGALLAYGTIVRVAGFFTMAGFVLATLLDVKRERCRLAGLGVPAVTAVALHATLNVIAAGHPVTSTYSQSVVLLLNGSNTGSNLLLYAAGLAAIPPFPLVALLTRSRSSDRWWLGALPIVMFFVPYAYHDQAPRFAETLVGGQRLVLSAHAFLMIATARVWGRLLTRRTSYVVIGGGIAVAILAALALNRIRAPYQEVAEAVAACAPERIGYDMGAARVVAGVSASRWRHLDGSDPRGQDDVVVVARGVVTNRSAVSRQRIFYPELESIRDLCRAIGRFEVYDLSGHCGQVGRSCEMETHE